MSFYLDHKTIIFIDSKNRISGTHSNFSYQINIPQENKYNRVCLLQSAIPKSYYLIQENLNTFDLDENSTVTTITIPAGNYSKTSIINKLTSVLNSSSAFGWVYSITYPNTTTEASTGKLTYTVTGNGGIQPKFIFGENIYDVLGFEKESTNTFTGDTITSENVINLQAKSAIYINSNIAKNFQNTILQEIFSNTADFSYISFVQHDIEGSSKEINNVGTNVYNFTITDTNGTILELNGLNVVFSLVLYRKNDIGEVHRKDIGFRQIEKIGR